MKTFKSTLLIFLLVIGITSCNEELVTSDFVPANELEISVSSTKFTKNKKATGSVEIVWKGGKKGGEKGSDMSSDAGDQPENLRAFFEFNAQEAGKNQPVKGEVVFLVTAQDLLVHREIRAKVLDVNFNETEDLSETEKRSWFVAEVISDSKGCNGGSGGEDHESGCSGEDHTDGGCGDDTEHDGGCSDGHTTEEGGCTDDHTTDEGGCSGTDHPDEGGQKPDVTGSEGKGNPLSGKNCRIGQLILVKVHDVATSGADGDEITWKWFAPASPYNITGSEHSQITVNNSTVHLCKKTIIGGNLVVHL